MRKKDIEKRIVTSLEDNASPLNPHILDKVKEEMRNNKKQSPLLKYAVGACVALVVCLAIVIPIVLMQIHSSDYQEFEYSSLRNYVDAAGIQIKTYDQVVDESGITEGETNFPYTKTACKVIKLNKEIVCIEESYDYTNGDKIDMFILLSDSDGVDKDLFSEYTDLDKETCISDINIEYNFDTASHIGKAKFSYDGHQFYVKLNIQSEDSIVLHLQTFIVFQ